jgi:hypothetical protein
VMSVYFFCVHVSNGNSFVRSVYVPCVHVSNGKIRTVTSESMAEVNVCVHSTRYLSLHIKKH